MQIAKQFHRKLKYQYNDKIMEINFSTNKSSVN